MGRQGWLDWLLSRESEEGNQGAGNPHGWHAGWILQPGQVLVNNYRIENMIGSPGGMGQVYVAEDISLRLKVAIKVPVLNILLAPKGAELFLEEARKAALLRPHHHIVMINACLTDPKFSVPVDDEREKVPIPFIVMEYLGGGDLAQRLRGGPMPFGTVADLFEKICLAVHYAHNYEYERKGQQLRGIIHRDLKPENICFDERGRPVVVDFGLARVLENPNTSGGITGTPTHMAPEQWAPMRYGKVDHRADIYALGVILYQMVTGQLPFNENSIEEYMAAHLTKLPPDPRNLRSDTPQRIVEIIQKSLEKDKQARFDNAQTLAENVLQGLGIVDQRESSDSPRVPDPSLPSVAEPQISERKPGIAGESTEKGNTWIELKPSGQRPTVGLGTRAVWDEDGRRMYVISINIKGIYDFEFSVFDVDNNSWERLSTSGSVPPKSPLYQAVLNSVARMIYIFGKGFPIYGLPNVAGMWIYKMNSNSWEYQEIPPELAETVYYSAVWDPKGNRIYAFGGRQAHGSQRNNLIWVFTASTNSWEKLEPAGEVPLAREAHSAVWDPNVEKMYIFGGAGSGYPDFEFYDDLWVYTPSTNSWNRLEPSGVLPPALSSHSAVWDADERKMYIFGGGSKSRDKAKLIDRNNDLREYNTAENTWKQLTMTGEPPEVRSGHTATWDNSVRRMYIFGGTAGDHYDLWAFSPEATPKTPEMRLGTSLKSKKKGPTWIELKPSDKHPAARFHQSNVWDQEQKSMYIFGGFFKFRNAAQSLMPYDDFWVYKVRENNWEELLPLGSPPTQTTSPVSGDLKAIFNMAAREIYVFGYSFPFVRPPVGGLWIYSIDSNTWDYTGIPSEVCRLVGNSMVLDPKGMRIFAFGGGIKGTNLLWIYSPSNNAWEKLKPTGKIPPARRGHSAVWDQNEEALYIFGGHSPSLRSYSDLWVYSTSTNSWNRLEPSGILPPLLASHSAIWDVDGRNMYVFGGISYPSTYHNDLWIYNATDNNWKQLAMTDRLPEARVGHNAVWDTSAHRMYIFGGMTKDLGFKVMNDLWAFIP